MYKNSKNIHEIAKNMYEKSFLLHEIEANIYEKWFPLYEKGASVYEIEVSVHEIAPFYIKTQIPSGLHQEGILYLSPL